VAEGRCTGKGIGGREVGERVVKSGGEWRTTGDGSGKGGRIKGVVVKRNEGGGWDKYGGRGEVVVRDKGKERRRGRECGD